MQEGAGFCVRGLLFHREIVLANAAERAGEIVGKVFPFGSRRDTVVGITEGFVVDVTANIANVFHNFVLLGFDFVRVVVAKNVYVFAFS